MQPAKVLIVEVSSESHLADALIGILESETRAPVAVMRIQRRPPLRNRDLADIIRSEVVRAAFLVPVDPAEYPWHDDVTLTSDVPLFAVTESDDPEELLDLLHRGFTSFLRPPLTAGEVLPRLWRALERVELETERPERRLAERVGLKRLIGESPAFVSETKKIPLVARCDASVMISGETGTGKELVARAIHYLSPRSGGPFVPINCGAIPDDLIENELFGHERGAYTGAVAASPGLVETADGGTLFLDEIDSLAPMAQVKLLRFLQEKEFRRLGSTRTCTSDVRVVAGCNTNVDRAVEKGTLRKDLYYRLNVIPIDLPPLRERPEDIALLAHHFLRRESARAGYRITEFTEAAMDLLTGYIWPGNVRELEHVIQRAVVLSGGRTTIRRRDTLLGDSLPDVAGEQRSFSEVKAQIVANFERQYLKRMLAVHKGNITHAAHAAKKNRRAFWELMRKHRIDVHRFKEL